MPRWIGNAFFALLCATDYHIDIGADAAGVSMPIRRGIEQGCPTNGSAWAILSDPMVCRKAEGLRGIPASLGVFADDLGVAMHEFLRAMPPIFWALRLMRLAVA